MLRYSLIIGFMVLVQQLFCQSFVNGNFENNTAGSDQINLSNDALNAMLPGVTSFGSYGDVDIIKSADYGSSGAQDKSWYMGITAGSTDIVALSLTQPLIRGQKYSLYFYDRKVDNYPATAIQVGLSEKKSDFGTVIYSCDEAPVLNKWTKRSFTFIAPNNGQYITVQMPVGDIYTWANIDNFGFNILKNNNEFTIKNPPKDSITISVTTPLKDTLIAVTNPLRSEIKQPLKFNPHRLNGRKLDVQETININEPFAKIMVWDKNRIDGDVISIYVNGQLIEENITVSKEKKEISVQLQPGINLVVMQAVNLGRVPPNTAALSINNHTKNKLITLVSDLKKSGTLEILYHPDAMSLN